MTPGLDAKSFVYLPGWAKLLSVLALAGGVLISVWTVVAFFGSTDARDWVAIGLAGTQFMITTLVVAVVLFFSQTDANICNLERRAEQFFGEVLPDALARVAPDDEVEGGCVVDRGDRRDIFGYDYRLRRGSATKLRLWCGVNVFRLIVIYRVVNHSRMPEQDFLKRLPEILRFTFGGAQALNYSVSYEPLAGSDDIVSIWLTVGTDKDLLTDPALKLFWSQDIAMMTESFLRTAHRHADEVRLDLTSRPRPQ